MRGRSPEDRRRRANREQEAGTAPSEQREPTSDVGVGGGSRLVVPALLAGCVSLLAAFPQG
eukprot:6047691-Pyramimonas_sp.AAC.1